MEENIEIIDVDEENVVDKEKVTDEEKIPPDLVRKLFIYLIAEEKSKCRFCEMKLAVSKSSIDHVA